MPSRRVGRNGSDLDSSVSRDYFDKAGLSRRLCLSKRRRVVSEETGKSTPKGESRTPPAAAPAAPAGRVRKALGGLGVLRGIIPGKTPELGTGTADASTRLAHQRTDLALVRNYMAAERTLMAWIRTSLSMISFGFTLGKLGQVLKDVEVRGFLGRVRDLSVESIAYFLVILGTLALLGAVVQHWLEVRECRAMGLRRRFSIAFVVALLLSVFGGFALSALVLKL